MTTTRYKVIGEVVHVLTSSALGKQWTMLYMGSVLPPDVSADRIQHLLSVGLIAPLPEDRRPVLASDTEPSTASQPSVDTPPDNSGGPDSDSAGAGTESPAGAAASDPDVEAQRAAARAELPTDGSLPPATATKAVWVEAAVARGYDYTAAAADTKHNLIGLLKG